MQQAALKIPMKSREKPNSNGWHVPRIWDSKEPVFLFGGGPSIKGQDFSGLAKYHSIGVNSSYRLGLDWIDVCFFGDDGWWDFLGGREGTRDFKGLIISCNPRKVFNIIPRIIQVNSGKPVGIDTMTNYVAWNYNTGFTAINLAYHFGARTIVLIGYDMRFNGREKNWHRDYWVDGRRPKLDKQLFKRWLSCVPKIEKDAKELGVTILNATPNSAIEKWPKVDWRDYL